MNTIIRNVVRNLAVSISLVVAMFLSVSNFAVEPAQSSVNINAAPAAGIAEILSGVGASKAQAIVDYRAKHGPFKSIEDIVLVKGIGEATVAKNKHAITLK